MDRLLDVFWQSFDSKKEEIVAQMAENLPRYIGAFLILVGGIIIAFLLYKLIMYLYKKFNINNLINRLEKNFFDTSIEEEKKSELLLRKKENRKTISETIAIDKLLAKSSAYYIFLVFFRLSIVYLGITEVEVFLSDLITYLPNLFIGIVIGFFGLRFADSVFDIVYNTLELSKQKTSMIIATGAKIIIIFVTFMLVLNYTKILDTFIINAIFIGFISMLTIAGGLAFGLGGKEVAQEILESLRK